jgi:hypothetical protein
LPFRLTYPEIHIASGYLDRQDAHTAIPDRSDERPEDGFLLSIAFFREAMVSAGSERFPTSSTYNLAKVARGTAR